MKMEIKNSGIKKENITEKMALLLNMKMDQKNGGLKIKYIA